MNFNIVTKDQQFANPQVAMPQLYFSLLSLTPPLPAIFPRFQVTLGHTTNYIHHINVATNFAWTVCFPTYLLPTPSPRSFVFAPIAISLEVIVSI